MEGFGELPPAFAGDSEDFTGFQPEPSKTPAKIAPAPLERPVRNMSSFMDVYNSKSTLEFVLDGLLPSKGLMYIGARSGTGKTILAIQIAVDLILGRDTMTMKRSADLPPQKILILSLEMGTEEFQSRIQKMYPDLTEEEQKLLDDGILIYSDPEPFKLWTPDHQVDLIRMVARNKVTGILIDSASISFATSLKDDTQVNESIAGLYLIRNKLTCWMIIVSHTRKLPAGIVGNMEDITVDELFGHSGVAQSASAVLLMLHDKKAEEGKSGKFKVVWLMNAKARFASEFPPFKMLLPAEPPLLFQRRTPIPLPSLSPETMAKARKVAKEISFGDALKDIDFGSIGGIDDDS